MDLVCLYVYVLLAYLNKCEIIEFVKTHNLYLVKLSCLIFSDC